MHSTASTQPQNSSLLSNSVVDKERNIRLGSGHRYFDINAPLNNTPWSYDSAAVENPIDLREEHLFEASTMFVCHTEKINDYTVLRPIVQRIINTPDKRHLLSTRVNANGGALDSYQNNRDNMLHWLFALTNKRFLDDEKRAFLKTFVKAIIDSGVSPIEKTTKTGDSALACALSNPDIDRDLLTFCASLHAESLLDLNDYKGEKVGAIEYMCLSDCCSEYFLIVADLIEPKDIQKNIEILTHYNHPYRNVKDAISYLENRLVNFEKTLIDDSIEKKLSSKTSSEFKI